MNFLQTALFVLAVLFGQLVHSAELAPTPAMDTPAEEIFGEYKNEKSDEKPVFGDWLFNGGFVDTSFSGINPEYRIAQGDKLLVQLWGGLDYQQTVVVDPQGNVFIPRVGPVKVLGVQNKELNDVVLRSIKRVYKANVEAYVALASSQTVKVFVSGMVSQPGIYEGQSADSVLRYIDKAGGIKPELGSYRQIAVKRHGGTIANIDLYRFIEFGEMANVQLQDGDLIFVGTRLGLVDVEGEVGFEGAYELVSEKSSLADIVAAVGKGERATHVTVVESNGSKVNARQYGVNYIQDVVVTPGALIRVSSQLRPESISVEVLGEHDSTTEVVLPWGSTLKDLEDQITFTSLSNRNAIQLFRDSVAQRQKDMLMASLKALEQSVLTATSATTDTAQLRQIEAQSVLAWVQRAKLVEPRGQVLLSAGYDPAAVVLVQGDKVMIPQVNQLVMIHGEVLFPTAITYQNGRSVEEYVAQAGGATGKLSRMNTLVMKPNGMFVSAVDELSNKKLVEPGDEIFVLAKPELKALQLTKDIAQVIYQIAVSAAVAVAL